MTWNFSGIKRALCTPRMSGWLGKVVAGILGLAGATSCLLQVVFPSFQLISTKTNTVNKGLLYDFFTTTNIK